jgi:SAM-dependent methyltransferase
MLEWQVGLDRVRAMAHARSVAMYEQNRRDWANFEPASIPTKIEVPHLSDWLDRLSSAGLSRVLDVGCGSGGVARSLVERGFGVVGVDINGAAVQQLSRELPGGLFYERDAASPSGLDLSDQVFDAAICQLLASVVGDAGDRAQLLRNICNVLRAHAPLFISFSGLSDDLNHDYGELYARDRAATGEHGSYYSRAADGRVLYRTHHFAPGEIRELLEQTGFEDVQIEAEVETSSRRPDQRARFYYASCRRR